MLYFFIQIKTDTLCPAEIIISLYIFWSRIPSYTSSDCILQLCKVSSISLDPFRKSWAYEKYGQRGQSVEQDDF